MKPSKDERAQRLKEIINRVNDIREHLPEANYQIVYHDRQFLCDLLTDALNDLDKVRETLWDNWVNQ